jgi:hypothetical protein
LPIWRLRWFDRNGNILSSIGDAQTLSSIALSPDDRQVAAQQGYPARDIWVYNLERGTGSRVTSEPGSKMSPLWSRDGKYVYYVRVVESKNTIARWRAESGGIEELFSADQRLVLQDITADGEHLILTGSSSESWGVYRLNLSGRQLETLLAASKDGRGEHAHLTRDERWLLLEAGPNKTEVYSYPSPGASPAGVIAAPHAAFLSPDGKTIYGFTEIPGGRVTSAPMFPASGGGLRLGPPSLLFPIRIPTIAGVPVAAMSHDGQRILAISGDPSEEVKVQILTDWSTLLKNPL